MADFQILVDILNLAQYALGNLALILTSMIVGICVEKLVFLALGPKIEYGVNYYVNRMVKYVKDSPVNVDFLRVSSQTKENFRVEDVRKAIIEKLDREGIVHETEVSDIKIVSYKYGSNTLSGYIRFSYSNFEKGYLGAISLEFPRICHYKTFSEDVSGLGNGVRKLEGIIHSSLPNDILFTDCVRCELKKLELLTGIINKMNGEKSVSFHLSTISEKMRIELSTKFVTISNDIESKGLIYLKELVTMYL